MVYRNGYVECYGDQTPTTIHLGPLVGYQDGRIPKSVSSNASTIGDRYGNTPHRPMVRKKDKTGEDLHGPIFERREWATGKIKGIHPM